MTRPPVGLSGEATGRITSWPGVSTAASASSPIVRPLTVHGVGVQHARLLQARRDQARAAGAVQIDRDEAAAGFQVREQRHLAR